ncbi:glycerophosphoryl diester phosphodiesterase membrane domain-containing protein [Streptomyces sp. AV19]|uniref:glycerophosphoryl diester phosphodiesterase membrane domain-containing protein n=1 Tax=Streptomyces sp. AV19 TaxID=2793068 RepID=UPI0018FEB474|nr:glycerophosphoryl diester phosphodiesterase membrane domain-containing protein [Streptomyces sp. AV19]MBH1932721.1 glycerophosphoryl diester phosphodiesterase membrane domain-containing protein [Streptomyces sp. AV19]MDG4531393.1 glycerophosphoryl diester phosphodiesterase membrane domain-containing protein [Streptomyces sp. AV19]
MNDSPGPGSPGPSPSGPPPPGWQQPGRGWGHQPWAPPPRAPQPGVIPLRPLGIGEILQGSLTTMLKHWRTVLPVSLGIALGTQAVTTVVTGLWRQDSEALESLRDNPSPRRVLEAMGDSMGSMGVTMVIGLIGSIIAATMLTMVVSRAVLGQSITAGEAWRSSRPQLARMAGLLCLIPLLMVGVLALATAPGLLLYAAGAEPVGAALVLFGALAGMAGTMWLWIRYCLAAPTLVLEKQGVIASMRRSAKLVRGAWWRIFGVQILALLLLFAVAMIVEIPVGIIQLIAAGDLESAASFSWTSVIIMGVGAVISSTLTLPFTAGVTALIYMDQRIRRESLDVELIRAAGQGPVA